MLRVHFLHIKTHIFEDSDQNFSGAFSNIPRPHSPHLTNNQENPSRQMSAKFHDPPGSLICK